LKTELRRWRERRGKEWGQTEYQGLLLEGPVDMPLLLVSKLSHGLRVIEMKNPGNYRFEEGVVLVEVSAEFLREVFAALEADRRFQQQLPYFESLIGS
jgi:hypothetical protein